MITSAILYGFMDFLRLILGGVLNGAPVSLDSGIGAAFVGIGNAVAVLDLVINVGLLIGTFVAVQVVVEGYIFGYKIVRWVYTKIPGIS